MHEPGAIERVDSAALDGAPRVLARLGTLEVRLAAKPAEIRSAMRLRHAVFVEEMGARLAGADPATGTESDAYDPMCDHIVVRDTGLVGLDGADPVVGTYRALRPEAAATGFYSQTEFDVVPLIARHGHLRFCEVGRSCVAASHRSMRTIEALWCGLWAYACLYGIDVYFGAASFAGTVPARHAEALSYLRHAVGAPHGWEVGAHPARAVAMDQLPASRIDRRAALRAMPPLIRGYLRVNAHVGVSAYVDFDFGTTDVMILTRLAAMPDAYRSHFIKVTGRDFAR